MMSQVHRLEVANKTMKYLILLISIFFSLNCLAQTPNQNLFQTWYLSSIQASDLDTIYRIPDLTPSITPYVTILDNLEFSGEGACNTFNGKYNFQTPNILTSDNNVFSKTTNDCGIALYNSFENSYIGFMNGTWWYEITQDGNDLILTIYNGVFGHAVFKNTTLSSTDFALNKIKVYPIPSNSKVFINSNKNLTRIEIYNPIGQRVKIVNNNLKNFDISDLSDGVYMLKIFTEFGHINRRIIKQISN
jgi:heat shock protein HslJ